MPTSTPNGFIKTGSGRKGVATKEAEAQTRESMEASKAKDVRRRSKVGKRKEDAVLLCVSLLPCMIMLILDGN